MTDIEKLRVLLPHWIEHNKSHSKEFKKWMEIIKSADDPAIADLLQEALSGLEKADLALSDALDKLGGPPENDAEGHDHHHH